MSASDFDIFHSFYYNTCRIFSSNGLSVKMKTSKSNVWPEKCNESWGGVFDLDLYFFLSNEVSDVDKLKII